jgi:hypothetical protein
VQCSPLLHVGIVSTVFLADKTDAGFNSRGQ